MARTKTNTGVNIATTEADAAVIAKEEEAKKAPGSGFTPGKNSVRAEERAKQAEKLEAVRDKLNNMGLWNINLNELLSNREALAGLGSDRLKIHNPQPGYDYGWFVREDELDMRTNGYEYVVGSMPENLSDAEGYRPEFHDDPALDSEDAEHKDILFERRRDLGRRRRNELTLMRIRLDDKMALRMREIATNLRFQLDMDQKLVEQAVAQGFNMLPMDPREMRALRQRRGIQDKPRPTGVSVPNNPRDLDRQLREGTLGQ